MSVGGGVASVAETDAPAFALPEAAGIGSASTSTGGAVVATPPSDGSAETLGSRLVCWTESHGGRASGKVAFLAPGHGGDRQCVARLPIQEDELLVEMPRSLAFETPPSQPLGVSSELMALLRPLVEQDSAAEGPVGRSLAVALLVHHERMRGDASEFAPYLDSLPLSFPTMPILDPAPPWAAASEAHARPSRLSHANSGICTDGERGSSASAAQDKDVDDPAFYKGTGVEQLAMAQGALAGPEGVKRMRDLIEQLDPEGLYWHHAQRGNDDALRWAAAAVQSRAHASRRGGTALVPLADCFNHSPVSPNAELREGETSFQVRALRNVSVGEELFLSYGALSNAELVFNGGFTCSRNPNDSVVVSRLDLLGAAQQRWRSCGMDPPDSLEARCKQLSAGMSPPRLRSSAPLLGGSVPVEVATLLVGLLLDEDTWRKHVDKCPGSIHELWAVDRSLAAELLRAEMLHALVELTEQTLRVRYASGSADEETSALASAESLQNSASVVDIPLLRRINILRVRLGERRILEQLSKVLQSRLRTAPLAVPAAQVATETATATQPPPPKRLRQAE